MATSLHGEAHTEQITSTVALSPIGESGQERGPEDGTASTQQEARLPHSQPPGAAGTSSAKRRADWASELSLGLVVVGIAVTPQSFLIREQRTELSLTKQH